MKILAGLALYSEKKKGVYIPGVQYTMKALVVVDGIEILNVSMCARSCAHGIGGRGDRSHVSLSTIQEELLNGEIRYGRILLCALPLTAAGEERAPIRVMLVREALRCPHDVRHLKTSDF